MRSGSSPKDSSGGAGVSSRRASSAEVTFDGVTEGDLGVAGHPVVGVRAERGDLDDLVALAGADGAEGDAGVPHRVGPAGQQLLHGRRAGVGGEVQVGAQPAQQRVPHAAADQVQRVPGRGETVGQLRHHRGYPHQLGDRGALGGGPVLGARVGVVGQ
jgi:hypothetical protein